MIITSAHVERLEQRHDRTWLCRNLAGQIALLLYEPDSVCYSIIAKYRNQVWNDVAGSTLTRAQVADAVSGPAVYANA